MTRPRKKPAPRGDRVTLTPSDEAALDTAWESITDAEIEASIRWLNSLPRTRKRKQKETPPHGDI